MTEITWFAQSCCGTHKTGQVKLGDNRDIFIQGSDENGYAVILNKGGIVDRTEENGGIYTGIQMDKLQELVSKLADAVH